MKVIIPVAGMGNRLKPHTYTKPKVLLPVAGKPILGHIIDSVPKDKTTEFIFITGYMGEMIRQYVKKSHKIKARYIRQSEQLGLGHAISLAVPHFTKEPLLIILGDTIFDADLTSLIASKHSALCVKKVLDPSRFGVAVLKGKTIKKLVEKPETKVSDLALVGIYFIREPQALSLALRNLLKSNRKSHNEYQLTDALQIMIDRGTAMGSFPIDGWYDCGKPESLLATNRYLLKRDRYSISGDRMPDCVIVPPIYVDSSATIRNSVIGPYVSVGPGAKIRGCVVSDSLIGESAEVLDCTLHASIVGNQAGIVGSKRRLNVGDSSTVELS